MNKKTKIAIIGLGYVGLPLMVEFAKKFAVVGFDINSTRISDLKKQIDETMEVNTKGLGTIKNNLSAQPASLENQDFFIVTVPTPINENKSPNIQALKSACKMIGSYLNKGNCVIFESTVYPGLTEEVCVPILEKTSGLKLNKDFSVGYSPERINPGDKKRKLTQIIKVVSASNPKALLLVDELYSSIITAGTHKVSSIRAAEAAKIIENTQRDINIALMNELSMLFNKMGIDFQEVLKASNTKWNFLDFKPGLVGGHCIGVDPYYLTFKARQEGYEPKMINAGRTTNEMMPKHIFLSTKQRLKKNGKKLEECTGLILGATFKEDCPDFRNSKVEDVVKLFQSRVKSLFLHDPYFLKQSGAFPDHIKLFKSQEAVFKRKYDFIIIAVPHTAFKKIGHSALRQLLKKKGILFDLKSLFPSKYSELSL